MMDLGRGWRWGDRMKMGWLHPGGSQCDLKLVRGRGDGGGHTSKVGARELALFRSDGTNDRTGARARPLPRKDCPD